MARHTIATSRGAEDFRVGRDPPLIFGFRTHIFPLESGLEPRGGSQLSENLP
jgi:hypothetical protein